MRLHGYGSSRVSPDWSTEAYRKQECVGKPAKQTSQSQMTAFFLQDESGETCQRCRTAGGWRTAWAAGKSSAPLS